MTSIANRSLDRLDNAALEEATRYDVYCWAEDAALDGWGMARPNLMSQDRFMSLHIITLALLYR